MSLFRDFNGITRFTDLNGVLKICVATSAHNSFFLFESVHRKNFKNIKYPMYWVDFLRVFEEKIKPQKENQHECSFCNRKFKTELELITRKKERHAVV